MTDKKSHNLVAGEVVPSFERVSMRSGLRTEVIKEFVREDCWSITTTASTSERSHLSGGALDERSEKAGTMRGSTVEGSLNGPPEWVPT